MTRQLNPSALLAACRATGMSVTHAEQAIVAYLDNLEPRRAAMREAVATVASHYLDPVSPDVAAVLEAVEMLAGQRPMPEGDREARVTKIAERLKAERAKEGGR
jgi:hypothetical protein